MTELIQVTQPLYGQIKTAIEKRIRAAEWPADFQVPREEDLAAEFGASAFDLDGAVGRWLASGDRDHGHLADGRQQAVGRRA